jgi:hypothetical protein
MTTKNLQTAIIAVLLFAGNAEAQEYPPKYSLQQCLDFAVDNSYADLSAPSADPSERLADLSRRFTDISKRLTDLSRRFADK